MRTRKSVAPATENAPSKRQRLSLAPSAAAKAKAELEHLPDTYTETGRIFVLGSGDFGQLGLGADVDEKLRPGVVSMPDGEEAVQVTAGGMHTVCLCKSGTVYTWGVNDEGALGRYTEGEAWKRSGKAKGAPGDPAVPVKVALPAKAGRVLEVSAGDSHSAARTQTGAVYVWGTFRDGGGVMGFSPEQRIQVMPTLVWEPNHETNRVVQIASGADHIAALCSSGDVLTWGNGQQGQLGRVGTRFSSRGPSRLEAYLTPGAMHLPFSMHNKACAVACGTYSTFVVMATGAVFACGLNQYAQLGLPPGEPVFAPKPVKGVPPVASVAAADHHTLFLGKDGELFVVGRPTYGRLGLPDIDMGSDEPITTPTKVEIKDAEGEAAEGKVIAVSAGGPVSGVSLDRMCSLWMCGCGTNNQLGKGDDDDDEQLFVKVKRTKTFNEVIVRQLKFGGQHAVFFGTPCSEGS